jgi:hypothetical protein
LPICDAVPLLYQAGAAAVQAGRVFMFMVRSRRRTQAMARIEVTSDPTIKAIGTSGIKGNRGTRFNIFSFALPRMIRSLSGEVRSSAPPRARDGDLRTM